MEKLPVKRIVIIDGVRVFIGFSDQEFREYIYNEVLQVHWHRLARERRNIRSYWTTLSH